jgi:hypothetical protein
VSVSVITYLSVFLLKGTSDPPLAHRIRGPQAPQDLKDPIGPALSWKDESSYPFPVP